MACETAVGSLKQLDPAIGARCLIGLWKRQQEDGKGEKNVLVSGHIFDSRIVPSLAKEGTMRQ